MPVLGSSAGSTRPATAEAGVGTARGCTCPSILCPASAGTASGAATAAATCTDGAGAAGAGGLICAGGPAIGAGKRGPLTGPVKLVLPDDDPELLLPTGGAKLPGPEGEPKMN